MINLLLTLIYTHTIALILAAAFSAYLIALALNIFFKLKHPYGFVYPIAFIIFFAVQFSPLPSPLQKNIVLMLDSLVLNKTSSYALINSVLIPCLDEHHGFLRGYKYKDVLEVYKKDMDNHTKEHPGGFSLPKTDQVPMVKETDLCLVFQLNTLV